MSKFKRGDKVRRIPSQQCGAWDHGDTIMTVAAVSATGDSICFQRDGNYWTAEYFELASKETAEATITVTLTQFRELYNLACSSVRTSLKAYYLEKYLEADEIQVSMSEIEKYLAEGNPDQRKKAHEILNIKEQFEIGEPVWCRNSNKLPWWLRYYAGEGQVYQLQRTTGGKVYVNEIMKYDPNNLPKG